MLARDHDNKDADWAKWFPPQIVQWSYPINLLTHQPLLTPSLHTKSAYTLLYTGRKVPRPFLSTLLGCSAHRA